MKKILIPTDFSTPSLKAFRFAVQQTIGTQTELVLMHHTSILELAPDSAFTGLYVPPPLDQVAYVRTELERFIKKGLKSFKGDVKFPKITPEVIPGIGTVETILETQKRTKAEAIIMGTTGASGVKRLFIGSVAAKVLELSKVPVLVIPENFRLKPIRKIGYASDLSHVHQDLEQIKPFSELMHSNIEIFHIEPMFPASEAFLKFKAEKEIPALRATNGFSGLDYKLIRTRFDNDFFVGVENYRRKQKPDILAIVTHKRNWLGKILNPSHSKNLAYHTKIPVLAIK
jgi:nucleotide-binding universal stress UspA family protein